MIKIGGGEKTLHLFSILRLMIIVYILIGLIIGSLGLYLILRNKLKVTQEYNLEI